MEQNKKERFIVVCDYQTLLGDTLNWYNNTYGTDFELVNYYVDNVGFAVIECSSPSYARAFDIGFHYGRKSEAYDKKLSNPGPSSFR